MGVFAQRVDHVVAAQHDHLGPVGLGDAEKKIQRRSLIADVPQQILAVAGHMHHGEGHVPRGGQWAPCLISRWQAFWRVTHTITCPGCLVSNGISPSPPRDVRTGSRIP
jgi:hypothetical protein